MIKNKIFILTTLLFLLLAIIFNNLNKQETTNYKIKDKSYKLLVADSPKEWERGLMDIRKLNNADGMIFLFPDIKPRVFWNKNTYVDLDIYWIFNYKVVGRDFLPSINKSNGVVYVSSPVPVNKVVEIIIK